MQGPRFFFAFLLSSASATSNRRHPAVQQLATFPGFAENIAVRFNNHILVTSLENPSVRYLNPANPNVTTLLPPIPGINGVSGIAELEHDVFVVAAGIWNTTARRQTNGSIWTLDFRKSLAGRPILKKVVDIPEAKALNSVTVIPGTSIALISNSDSGSISAIDTTKHTYSTVIRDEALTSSGSESSIGVNGIKVKGSYLYFANSARGIFGRIPISRTGTATGSVEQISSFPGSDTSAIDDFALDDNGNAWISFHPNTIFKVDREGRQEVIVNGSELLDPTSVVLGRGGPKERRTLYVSVNIFGDKIVGGVAAVDLSKYSG